MDHVKSRHCNNVLNIKNKKSKYLSSENFEELIQAALKYGRLEPHNKYPDRYWCTYNFDRVIGHRGKDGAECKWIGVSVPKNDPRGSYITAYPIVGRRSSRLTTTCTLLS